MQNIKPLNLSRINEFEAHLYGSESHGRVLQLYENIRVIGIDLQKNLLQPPI
jgi:hypothetical protein